MLGGGVFGSPPPHGELDGTRFGDSLSPAPHVPVSPKGAALLKHFSWREVSHEENRAPRVCFRMDASLFPLPEVEELFFDLHPRRWWGPRRGGTEVWWPHTRCPWRASLSSQGTRSLQRLGSHGEALQPRAWLPQRPLLPRLGLFSLSQGSPVCGGTHCL